MYVPGPLRFQEIHPLSKCANGLDPRLDSLSTPTLWMNRSELTLPTGQQSEQVSPQQNLEFPDTQTLRLAGTHVWHGFSL